MLTNAKRVASVRAETYVNLYSLSVEHFKDVLERYPVMRRTMESVAAERLTKIGKNPSIVSSRADLDEDQRLLNEIVMESTPVVTSASEDEDKDSDDSSSSSKSTKHKKKFKLDFSAKLHKITEERKSRSRENLKDFAESKFRNILRKAPSGPNLFGLLAPPTFNERKRSGSVGANLGMIDEIVPDSSQDDSVDKRRQQYFGNKFSKKLVSKDAKQRKSSSKTSICDDLSPSAETKNMQFLTVPQGKRDSKSKDHSHSQTHSSKGHSKSSGDSQAKTSGDSKINSEQKHEDNSKEEKLSDNSAGKVPISEQKSDKRDLVKMDSKPESKVDKIERKSSEVRVNFALNVDDLKDPTVPTAHIAEQKVISEIPEKTVLTKKDSGKKKQVEFQQAQLIPVNEPCIRENTTDKTTESKC